MSKAVKKGYISSVMSYLTSNQTVEQQKETQAMVEVTLAEAEKQSSEETKIPEASDQTVITETLLTEPSQN